MDVINNYKVTGAGIPLVFQHGLAANLDQSQNLLVDMEGVQLISMDCPGHGNSALINGHEPSFDFYGDQVLKLLRHLGIKNAVFGGISMGSGIALNIALRNPEIVTGLMLVRPAWLDQVNPPNLNILRMAANYIQKGAKREFTELPDFMEIQRVVPNAAQSVLGVFDVRQRPELFHVLECMVSDKPIDQLQKLQAIDVPCLIIANDDDPLHPYSMAASLHQEIPGSEIHKVISRYIDDQAHTNAVNSLISTFIQDL